MFQTLEGEKTFLNLFYRGSFTLKPKPDDDIIRKRKVQTNLPYEHRCKILRQTISKPHPAIQKKDDRSDGIPLNVVWVRIVLRNFLVQLIDIYVSMYVCVYAQGTYAT